MKCIKFREYVRRVSNEKAEQMIVKHGWKYATKKEWKKAGRQYA